MRALIALALVGCTAADDVPAPAVSGLVPDHSVVGATITILGDYFCQQPDTGDEDPLACANPGAVEFGQVPGTVGMYTDHMITAEVPGLAPGMVTVGVASAGRRSNRVDFLVDPP